MGNDIDTNNLPPGWHIKEIPLTRRANLMRKTIRHVIELDEFNNNEIIELSKIMHEMSNC